jgi:formylglycine-generating enzyme required for sulfatase activity
LTKVIHEFITIDEGPAWTGLSSDNLVLAKEIHRPGSVCLVSIGCLHPMRKILVPEFQISKYPVTRKQFLDWVLDDRTTQYSRKEYWKRFKDEWIYDDNGPTVSILIQ